MNRPTRITAAAALAVALAVTLTACKSLPGAGPNPFGSEAPSAAPSESACAVPAPGAFPTPPTGQHPLIDGAQGTAQPGPDGNLYYYEVLTVHVYDDTCDGRYSEVIGEHDVSIEVNAESASGGPVTLWNKTTQKPVTVSQGNTMQYFSKAPVVDEQHLQQLTTDPSSPTGQRGITRVVWHVTSMLPPGYWMTCDLHDVGSMSQVSEDTDVNSSSGTVLGAVYCQWPLDLKPHLFNPYLGS